MPELNFVFNVVHDVFILRTPDWKESVIYGVFTSQWWVGCELLLYTVCILLGRLGIYLNH